MNGANVHLLLNHVPILGTILGTLLLALAALRRSQELARVSLLGFVVFALVGLPTYFSGERAEDVVERLAGVTKAAIETHEDAALPAFVALEALGVLALVGLVVARPPRQAPAWLLVSTLVLGAVTAGLMARVGNLGGRIHHPEIAGAGVAAVPED